jgi:hypothetical protein
MYRQDALDTAKDNFALGGGYDGLGMATLDCCRGGFDVYLDKLAKTSDIRAFGSSCQLQLYQEPGFTTHS